MKYKFAIWGTAILLAGGTLFAGGPAAPFKDSSIDARLNVTVKPDTDIVHFVRDNADPNVITKAYTLKYVDPYELRSYIRGIVQTRKVDDKNTNVEAVKFTDGTSILLISAEDYRFADAPNAQGFDSIVKELDRPKLVSSSGNPSYVYSPKYRSAEELAVMLREVGLYNQNAVMNNIGGKDVVMPDNGLNLLFFKTAPFSRKIIMDLLEKYDRPYPQVRTRVTVYELYAENDTKLGMDFQAWKNNDGVDLFNVGGRFSRNHNAFDLVKGAKWNDTTYFQFNPKWNTKYIDFLTTKGKAKVLHTSEITLRNNNTGKISRTTQVFAAKATPIDKVANREFYTLYNAAANEVIGMRSGKEIRINAAAAVSVLQLGTGSAIQYVLRVVNDADAQFVVDGVNNGQKVSANYVVPVIEAALKQLSQKIRRGNNIEIEKSAGNFGFEIELTPSINIKAARLNVKVSNRSLIGYTSDGSPRIQQEAVVESDFMISNAGTRLAIGGIEKRSVMRVSGGIPLLKDLPLLGWIFSTETEATKRSQLLVVAEVVPETAADSYKESVDKVRKSLSKAGESNSFGYRQFLIDPERTK